LHKLRCFFAPVSHGVQVAHQHLARRLARLARVIQHVCRAWSKCVSTARLHVCMNAALLAAPANCSKRPVMPVNTSRCRLYTSTRPNGGGSSATAARATRLPRRGSRRASLRGGA
jgi:hypothetical protein